MREEIPQWCWYNGMFLFSFDEALQSEDKNKTLKEFYNSFKEQQGLSNFPFSLKNQGAVICFLYAFLVIPREIWERDEEQGTEFSFKTIENFDVTIGKDQADNTWNFLRLMRNAISHANFNIDTDENKYTFWNNDRQGNHNFEVKVSHSGLGEFLTEVGKYYINEVRNKTSS